MGYETKFSLEMKGEPSDVLTVEKFLNWDGEEDPVSEGLREKLEWFLGGVDLRRRPFTDDVLDFVGNARARSAFGRYYDHADLMKPFSRVFPSVLFVLYGEGEDAGDLWTKYFRDGLMQEAKAVITYAPFDPEKLR